MVFLPTRGEEFDGQTWNLMVKVGKYIVSAEVWLSARYAKHLNTTPWRLGFSKIPSGSTDLG